MMPIPAASITLPCGGNWDCLIIFYPGFRVSTLTVLTEWNSLPGLPPHTARWLSGRLRSYFSPCWYL